MRVPIYCSDKEPYVHSSLLLTIFQFCSTFYELWALYTDTEHSWYLGLKLSQILGRWPCCPATLFLLSTSADISFNVEISLSWSSWALLFSGRRCFQSDMIIGILPEVRPIRQRDWTVPCNEKCFHHDKYCKRLQNKEKSVALDYLFIHLWDSIGHILKWQELHPQVSSLLVQPVFWRHEVMDNCANKFMPVRRTFTTKLWALYKK